MDIAAIRSEYKKNPPCRVIATEQREKVKI